MGTCTPDWVLGLVCVCVWVWGGGGMLPSDGGPGAHGGLGIFQHAPLHDWTAIRSTFLYISRKAPMSIISLLASEWFSPAWISTQGPRKYNATKQTPSLQVASISKHVRKSSAEVVTVHCLPVKWILAMPLFFFFFSFFLFELFHFGSTWVCYHHTLLFWGQCWQIYCVHTSCSPPGNWPNMYPNPCLVDKGACARENTHACTHTKGTLMKFIHSKCIRSQTETI